MLEQAQDTISNLEQYKVEVSNRLNNLDAEEVKVLANMYGSPELIMIGKIIGPEVSQALAEGVNEISRSLQQKGQEAVATQERQPIRSGLGAR
jgi:hypothetical protein